VTKTKNPLFSLGARGTLGDITYLRRRRTDIAEKTPVLPYFLTLPVQYQRWLYQDYACLWRHQDAATRRAYAASGSRFHLTGFQYWMKYHLKNLPDLAAWWTLDEKAGTIAHDRSRNANHGTIIGATPASGLIGGALYFDGLSNRVNIPDSPHLHFTTALTVETYIYSTLDDGTWRSLVTKWNTQTENDRTFMLAQNTAGNYDFRIFGVTADYINTPLVLNRWVHLVGVFDPPNLLIYVGGVLANSKVTSVASLEINDYLVILGSQGHYRRFFEGYEDQVALWNIALPPKLIKVHSERRWPLP